MYSTYPARAGTSSAASSATTTASKGTTKGQPKVTVIVPSTAADDMKGLKEELAKLQAEEATAVEEDRQRHGFVKRVRASRSLAGTTNASTANPFLGQQRRNVSQSSNYGLGGTLNGIGMNENLSFGGNDSRDDTTFVPLSETVRDGEQNPMGSSALLSSQNDNTSILQGAYLQSGQTPPLQTPGQSQSRHRIDINIGSTVRGGEGRLGSTMNGNHTTAMVTSVPLPNNGADKTFLFSEQMETERSTMLVEAMALRQTHAAASKTATVASTVIPNRKSTLLNSRQSIFDKFSQDGPNSKAKSGAMRRLPFLGGHPLPNDDAFMTPNANTNLAPSVGNKKAKQLSTADANAQSVSILIQQIANKGGAEKGSTRNEGLVGIDAVDSPRQGGRIARSQSISLLSKHFGGGLLESSLRGSAFGGKSAAASAHAEALKELNQALREEGLPMHQVESNFSRTSSSPITKSISRPNPYDDLSYCRRVLAKQDFSIGGDSPNESDFPLLKRVDTNAPHTLLGAISSPPTSPNGYNLSGPGAPVTAFEARVASKYEQLAEREQLQRKEDALLRSGALGLEDRVQRDGTFMQPDAQTNERYQLALLREERKRAAQALVIAPSPDGVDAYAHSGRSYQSPSQQALVRELMEGSAEEGADSEEAAANALAIATMHARLVMRHVSTYVKDTKTYVSSYRRRLDDFDAHDVAKVLAEQCLGNTLDKLEAEEVAARAPQQRKSIIVDLSADRVLSLEELEAIEAAEKAEEEAEAALKKSRYGASVSGKAAVADDEPSPFTDTKKKADPMNKYLLKRDAQVRTIQRLFHRRRAQRIINARRTDAAKHNADRIADEEKALRDVPYGSGDPEADAIEAEIAELEELFTSQAQQLDDFYAQELAETMDQAARAIQSWVRRSKATRLNKAMETVVRATRLYSRRRDMASTLASGRGQVAEQQVEVAVEGAIEDTNDMWSTVGRVAVAKRESDAAVAEAVAAANQDACLGEGRVVLAEKVTKEVVDEAIDKANVQ